MGEANWGTLRLDFDGGLLAQFSRLQRELDDKLDLTDAGAETLADTPPARATGAQGVKPRQATRGEVSLDVAKAVRVSASMSSTAGFNRVTFPF